MKPTYQSILFGEIMRQNRIERRLKPMTAACLAGIAYSTWNSLEKGRYDFTPTPETIDKICNVLHISKHSKTYRKLNELYQVHNKVKTYPFDPSVIAKYSISP